MAIKKINENLLVDFERYEGIKDRWKCSFDGGKTWLSKPFYNEENIMLAHLLGEYHVRFELKPELKKDESLCRICMNKGKVGIVKYAGRESGTETVTKVRYIEDAEIHEDVSFGVAYDTWRCQRCGHLADSEYA